MINNIKRMKGSNFILAICLVIALNFCIDLNASNKIVPVIDSANVEIQKRDTCLLLINSDYLKDSADIYKKIYLKPDKDSSDFGDVNEFNYSYRNKNYDKCKEMLNNIDNYKIRDSNGRTILDMIIENPNAEFLNLVLEKQGSIDYLWKNKNILYEIVSRIFYNHVKEDTIIYQSGIIEKLVNSNSCSKHGLRRAYDLAQYGDLFFIEEIIKKKYQDISSDSSKKISICNNELKDLTLLLKVSRERVIDQGTHAFGTCQMNEKIFEQSRQLKLGFQLFDKAASDKYYLNDSMFISGVHKIDYSEVLILWTKRGENLESKIIFDKLFNTGKFTSVLVDSVYKLDENSNFIVFRTKGSDGGYGSEKLEFCKWTLPRHIEVLYSEKCFSDMEKNDYLSYTYTQAASLLKIKKIREQPNFKDSLIFVKEIDLSELITSP